MLSCNVHHNKMANELQTEAQAHGEVTEMWNYYKLALHYIFCTVINSTCQVAAVQYGHTQGITCMYLVQLYQHDTYM